MRQVAQVRQSLLNCVFSCHIRGNVIFAPRLSYSVMDARCWIGKTCGHTSCFRITDIQCVGSVGNCNTALRCSSACPGALRCKKVLTLNQRRCADNSLDLNSFWFFYFLYFWLEDDCWFRSKNDTPHALSFRTTICIGLPLRHNVSHCRCLSESKGTFSCETC